ncbi:thymidine phosphorylase, partial [Diretmus argenteus]
VPMISGRGLAHTGGTLDKLESIPGFNIHQPVAQVQRILASVGCCIMGQTETLVPADRVLYALRDATNTVDSVPLITGSIISKKAAESLTALVLDVKFGQAALYKDLASAKELAQSLMTVGNRMDVRTGAVLSRMDAPIGRCVGNSLEVIESLETLKGNGPGDLMELVTTLGGVLLMMTGRVSNLSEGSKQILEAVIGGAALSKFQAMMEAQGVASEIARALCSAHTDYYSILRKAQHQMELKTPKDGVVMNVDGLVVAEVLHKLGAGRSKAGEPVNHSVGVELLVSLGQKVTRGVSWLRLHYDSPALTPDQINLLQNALTLGSTEHTHTLLIVIKLIVIKLIVIKLIVIKLIVIKLIVIKLIVIKLIVIKLIVIKLIVIKLIVIKLIVIKLIVIKLIVIKLIVIKLIVIKLIVIKLIVIKLIVIKLIVIKLIVIKLIVIKLIVIKLIVIKLIVIKLIVIKLIVIKLIVIKLIVIKLIVIKLIVIKLIVIKLIVIKLIVIKLIVIKLIVIKLIVIKLIVIKLIVIKLIVIKLIVIKLIVIKLIVIKLIVIKLIVIKLIVMKLIVIRLIVTRE